MAPGTLGRAALDPGPCIFLSPTSVPPGATPSRWRFPHFLLFPSSVIITLYFLAVRPTMRNKDAFPPPPLPVTKVWAWDVSGRGMGSVHTVWQGGPSLLSFPLPSGWSWSCHLGPQDGGQMLGMPEPDITTGSGSTNWLSF